MGTKKKETQGQREIGTSIRWRGGRLKRVILGLGLLGGGVKRKAN